MEKRSRATSMTTAARNVICISTIDWDFVWQGHQEIMLALARTGHRILFIENTGVRRPTLRDLPRLRHRLWNWGRGIRGIRQAVENVYVYSPLVLPFPYSRVARAINKFIMYATLRSWTRTMRFNDPVIWTWLPTPLALDLIRFLDGKLVVYYCCDHFEASSEGSRRIRKSEDLLIRTADLVFAHSKALFDRCVRLSDQVHMFQYGYNREVFARAGDRVPSDLQGIKPPILGYVGGVHQHVDLALLREVAIKHSDKSVVLVGPLQTNVDVLADLPNVHCLGQKKYEELPTYIKHFDVGLIPYALNDYTRNVYPTKLNEYLIMGKPVVSTPLPEVEHFNQCHEGIVSVAENQDAFVSRIAEELKGDVDSRRAQRISLVEGNAWDKKIETMQGLIQAKIEEKAKAREMNWRRTLAKFYRTSHQKFIGSAVGLGLAYLLVFHTPVVWWLAEPLRMTEPPSSADVIVVLAAGIGESGEPGEGYQEKVKYSAELYRQGYAQRLIFSSGVGYVFKEAQVMKALGISLGIPEAAIILDEQGGGNYVSLLNVRKVIETHGWTRMLLVTSRYNAARSHLVIRRNLPSITVTLTSAPHSVFFGEREQVTWKNLRAIGHEYLAILYYWLHGYI